jgi:hypothetical protein
MSIPQPAIPPPSPEELHRITLEVLLIVNTSGLDISRESVAYALATRQHLRQYIHSALSQEKN